MIDDFEIMDNFKAVYRILSELEKAMDLPEFDLEEKVGPEQLGITKERWMRYMWMMADVGYITGVKVFKNQFGELRMRKEGDIQITLNGLEYLQENTIMRRLYKAAKGIKDLVPGI